MTKLYSGGSADEFVVSGDNQQTPRDTMKTEHMIESLRWAPQRSIVEDWWWAVAYAAFTSGTCTLLGAATAIALLS